LANTVAVPTLDPEAAPNAAAPMAVEIASPPRSLPNHLMLASNKSSLAARQAPNTASSAHVPAPRGQARVCGSNLSYDLRFIVIRWPKEAPSGTFMKYLATSSYFQPCAINPDHWGAVLDCRTDPIALRLCAPLSSTIAADGRSLATSVDPDRLVDVNQTTLRVRGVLFAL